MKHAIAWALAFTLACAGLTAGAADAGCAAPARGAPHAPTAPIAAAGMRIGLALGSGSTHGLAHIGVLQEIEARGLDVQVVSGTSVGALVGSLWASGMSASEVESAARGRDWSAAGAFAGSWQGLFSNARLREYLAPLYRGRPIESWPRRFGAVATNLANGHRRILMSGDGVLAVQASSAVPVMFMPVTVNGEELADGALVEPVPVDAARALGADYVIAIDVGYRPYEEPASGLAGYAFQSMHILINTLAERQLRDADLAIRLDLHHRFTSCGPDALIEAGREAVRGAWPALEASLRARLDARR